MFQFFETSFYRPTPKFFIKKIPKMKKKEAESMARPAKPVNVIQMEKKSHRTKKELAGID